MRAKAKYFMDDVPPEEVVHVLLATRVGDAYTAQRLTDYFDERGWSHQARFTSNTLGRMIDLGLLGRNKQEYYLTQLGERLKLVLTLNPDSFYDYIHYLYLQKATEPGAREYFWTYWLLCNYVCERPGPWNGKESATIVMGQLEERFQVTTLAIDGGSLGKMLRWLRMMSPCPVNDANRKVAWREAVPARPFALGIDFFYRLSEIPHGYPILLTPEVRTTLRRIGFLTDTGLDEMLRRSAQLVPGLRLHTSVAGVSVILDRPVTIEGLEGL
jgi:hypothetical protein